MNNQLLLSGSNNIESSALLKGPQEKGQPAKKMNGQIIVCSYLK